MRYPLYIQQGIKNGRYLWNIFQNSPDFDFSVKLLIRMCIQLFEVSILKSRYFYFLKILYTQYKGYVSVKVEIYEIGTL